MNETTRSYYREAVRRAVDTIGGSLDEALDLERLARDAATSPFYFHRIFRGMLGETPLELHRRLRLERAAWTLVETGTSVLRVALDAGYETHSAFTRAFRTAFGVTPRQFREAAIDFERCGDLRAHCSVTALSGVHYAPDGPSPVHFPFSAEATEMSIEIRDVPGMRIAYVPHRGAYHTIGEAFGRLGAIAGPAGLFRPGANMVGVYHDDPESTPPAELRSEAGIVVADGMPIPDGLEERTIDAGRFAVMTHVGPYSGLGDAWSRMMGVWLPETGERVADGVCLEVYVNDAQTTPEAELATELFVPLAG